MDDPTVSQPTGTPAEPPSAPPPPPAATEPVPPPPPATTSQEPSWVEGPPPAVPPPPNPESVRWAAPEEPVGPAPGIEFAGFGARLVAYIVDVIIVSLVTFVLTAVALVILFGGMTFRGDELASISSISLVSGSLLFLLALLIALAYFPWFWARGGSTPGMSLMRIRVVRDRDGGRIGWGTAILRFIGLWVAFAVIYLGIIWIFIDQRRRGWQDLIAGTVVIQTH